MQIFVRAWLPGAVQAFHVQEADTVATVRQKIADAERRYPDWKTWRLMVGEYELRNDDKSLSHYRIEDGALFELHERMYVKLAIRCPPAGRVHMLECEVQDRILDCKKRLRDQYQQAPLETRQCFLLPNDGEELSDFVTLQEYGITTECILDLAVRQPRPIRVSVKTEDGRAFWLDMDEWDSIADLREKLSNRRCGTSNCKCRGTHLEDGLACIIYESEALDDDEQFFGAYAIPPGATLFLNERRLGERIAARAPPLDMIPQPSAAFLSGATKLL